MDLELDFELDHLLPSIELERQEEVHIPSDAQSQPQQHSMDVNMSFFSDTQLPIKKARGRPKGWRKSTGGAYTNVQSQYPSVVRSFEAPTSALNSTEKSSIRPAQNKHRGRPKGSKNRALDPEVVARVVSEARDGEVARPGRAARGEEINYDVKLAFRRLREVAEVDGTDREFHDARLTLMKNDIVAAAGEFAVVKRKDGRGRPKGSKNKDKSLVEEGGMAGEEKGRGRPRKGEVVVGAFEVTPIPGSVKNNGLKISPIVKRSFGGFMGTPVKTMEQRMPVQNLLFVSQNRISELFKVAKRDPRDDLGDCLE